MYVSAIEIRNSEIRIEINMLHSVSTFQISKPIFNTHPHIRQDVVIYVDFKAKNFALLELWLQSGVAASHFTVLNTWFL